MDEPNNRVADVSFSPDGRSLAIGTDRNSKMWDLTTRKARVSIPSGHALAFRPDGKILAVGGLDGAVRLAEIGIVPPREKTFGLFPKGGAIHRVAFTPEGRYLATANPDGAVYVLGLAGPGVVYKIGRK